MKHLRMQLVLITLIILFLAGFSGTTKILAEGPSPVITDPAAS